MKREKALEIATHVLTLLAPACAEIVVAGSLRREKAEVSDIELVGCFLTDREPRLAQSALDTSLIKALQTDVVTFDKATPRNGPLYKRLRVERFGGVHDPISIDLFLCERDNFGPTLLVRTGDAEFNKRLVSKRTLGGLMPDGFRQMDGYLQQWTDRSGWHTWPCPDEATYFAALGLPVVPPPERTVEVIPKLRAGTYRLCPQQAAVKMSEVQMVLAAPDDDYSASKDDRWWIR